MEATYRWKGSELGGSAQKPGERIAELRAKAKKKDENLLAQDVVNDARSPKSPLHRYFLWDDTAAAEQHRLHQARALIRSIEVVYKEPAKGKQTITVAVAHPPKTSLPTPKLPEPSRAGEIRHAAFVSVGRCGAPGYVTAAEIVDNKELREMALRSAMAQLVGLKMRFKHLNELSSIFAEIDRLAAIYKPTDLK